MFTENNVNRRLSPGEQADLEYLWLELNKFSASYTAGGATVDLPPVQPPILPDRKWTVILTDNGKDATVARLIGGSGLSADTLTAQLRVPLGQGNSTTILLPANVIEVDPRGVSAAFPSLKALGAAKPARGLLLDLRQNIDCKDPLYAKSDLMPVECKQPSTLQAPPSYQTHYVEGENAKESPPKLIPDIAAGTVIASAGAGKLTVGMQFDPGLPKRQAFIKLKGAEIETVTPGEVDELGRVKVASSGRYVLTLRNLTPASKVVVTTGLLSADGKKEEQPVLKELGVVDVPKPEPAASGTPKPST